MANRKFASQRLTLDLDGREIPIEVSIEQRRNVRFAAGKRHFFMRIPPGVSEVDYRRYFGLFEEFIRKTLAESPETADRFVGREYRTGDSITVGEHTYELEVNHSKGARSRGQLLPGTKLIQLDIGADIPKFERIHHARTLLSRTVARHQHAEVERRLMELNQLYFGVPVAGLRMKYNRTNWGSCSAVGNINISTRTLFAPPEVRDYVLIHELAHRLELNHSDRYWAHVASAMPEYSEHERWLRENGARCDF